MSFVSLTHMKNTYRIVAVVGIVCVSGLGLRGAARDHRAHLSDDLLSHVERHTDYKQPTVGAHGLAQAEK